MNNYLTEIEDSEESAIAIINIDNFKNLSSKYGEKNTEKIILQLSKILSSSTNYKDILARFGDEEFCVALQNVDKISAKNIFELIRQEVELSRLYTQENEEIRFTISIGVTMIYDKNLEESISQVDMLLYQVKEERFNRVISV